MQTNLNVGWLRHGEDSELGSKLERHLRLQLLDSPREVPDLEESLRVNVLPIEHVATVDMSQARRYHIQPRTRHNAVLDRDVFQMMIPNVRWWT